MLDFGACPLGTGMHGPLLAQKIDDVELSEETDEILRSFKDCWSHHALEAQRHRLQRQVDQPEAPTKRRHPLAAIPLDMPPTMWFLNQSSLLRRYKTMMVPHTSVRPMPILNVDGSLFLCSHSPFLRATSERRPS